jgi:predicted ATP-binding protein involved in virulence
MQLKKLSLTNFRAFKQAEFEFQPSMNLIVGVNGVGKSTVLDVISILMSILLPKFTVSKSATKDFADSDIRKKSISIFLKRKKLAVKHTDYWKNFSKQIRACDIFLQKMQRSQRQGKVTSFTVIVEFETNQIPFKYTYQKALQKYGLVQAATTSDDELSYQLDRRDRIRVRRQNTKGYDLGARDNLEPKESEIPSHLKTASEQPLVVFYSTRRSNFRGEKIRAGSKLSGQQLAFSDSLRDRDLNWLDFAYWWLAQEELGRETGKNVFGHRMLVLSRVISYFMDSFSNFRVERKVYNRENEKGEFEKIEDIQLLIDKEGIPVSVTLLSDGERGLLFLIIDLARRLTQANPKLPDPLHDGKAVVLIDELDLHLHPRWQRDVVEKLTRTFPNCQFIATTHSPQIVGEVSPENITILDTNKAPYRPDRSLGMDTNWILRHLMETPERTGDYQQMLDDISALIAEKKYDLAMLKVQEARSLYVVNDEIVGLQAKIERIKFLGK